MIRMMWLFALSLSIPLANAAGIQIPGAPHHRSPAGTAISPAPRPIPVDSLAALRALGERSIREQHLDQALAVFRRIAASVPGDRGATITLADLYSWTGDYDHAIALYRDAVDQDSVNLAAWKGLARVMRWATRYVEAEQSYARVLSIEPLDVDALLGMAQLFAQQRDLERALGYLERANRIAPDNPEILLTRGDILAWGNQFTKAEASYRALLRIDPGSSPACRSLGDMYAWMGRPTQAAEMYRKAHELDPQNPDFLVKLANASIDAGRPGEAEEAVRALFSLDPNSTSAYQILRRVEARQSMDYAAVVNNYAKPVFLILSNVVLGLYFRSRKERLRKHGGRYWRVAYYAWPVLAGVWLIIFLVAANTGFARVVGLPEVAEFTTLVVWMVAFVTLVWMTRTQHQVRNKVILAIGAHPDDIELGCGGTLSRYNELGYKVYGLVMTTGEEGNPYVNEGVSRRGEAESGAMVMGLDRLWVYNLKDTQLGSQINEMKNIIEEKIRLTCAEIIVTQSPHDVHQDHRAVFEATKIAARGDRSLLCYEDVSTEAHFAANYFVDITDYLGDKVRAVQAHRTQRQKSYMSPENITGRALHRGMQTGVRYAEAFLLYKGVDLWPS
jgi:LmbE family N-acetylglucosaminyl deacetylase/tetratricopeptide (TPR) repeat protein